MHAFRGGARPGSRTLRRFAPLVMVLVAAVMAVAFAVSAVRWPSSDPERVTPNGTRASAERRALMFVEVPRPLPTVRFLRGDGRVVTLDEFRGRAVLLNLWATWCVPCRVEMPALDRLQAALGGAAFEVVALSIDRGGPQVVETFYREVGLRSLAVYVDPTGEAARVLGTVGIPTTLLIDREGREVARKTGPAEWDGAEMVGAIRRHLGLPGVAGRAGAAASTQAE